MEQQQKPETYIHRIRANKQPTAVRERIERTLGIRTDAQCDPFGCWWITFSGPREIDLDFLRPDILPPR